MFVQENSNTYPSIISEGTGEKYDGYDRKIARLITENRWKMS